MMSLITYSHALLAFEMSKAQTKIKCLSTYHTTPLTYKQDTSESRHISYCALKMVRDLVNVDRPFTYVLEGWLSGVAGGVTQIYHGAYHGVSLSAGHNPSVTILVLSF